MKCSKCNVEMIKDFCGNFVDEFYEDGNIIQQIEYDFECPKCKKIISIIKTETIDVG